MSRKRRKQRRYPDTPQGLSLDSAEWQHLINQADEYTAQAIEADMMARGTAHSRRRARRAAERREAARASE